MFDLGKLLHINLQIYRIQLIHKYFFFFNLILCIDTQKPTLEYYFTVLFFPISTNDLFQNVQKPENSSDPSQMWGE